MGGGPQFLGIGTGLYFFTEKAWVSFFIYIFAASGRSYSLSSHAASGSGRYTLSKHSLFTSARRSSEKLFR